MAVKTDRLHLVAIWALSFLVMASLLSANSVVSTNVQSALWEFDLHAFGYQGPQTRADDFLPLHERIAFLNDATLAVAFTTREEVEGLARRSNPPLHLHVLLLDAGSGRLTREHEWGVSSTDEAGILATNSGNLVIRTGDQVTLYSPDFEELRERELPACESPGEKGWWTVLMAPSGRTLFLNHLCYGSEKIDVIDANTFKLLYSWPSIGPGPESVSDSAISALRSQKSKPDGVYLGKFDGSWGPIYEREGAGCIGHPSFISNSMLAFFGPAPCSRLVVITTQGSKLMEERFPKNEHISPVIPSRDGRRFAVWVDTEKGGIAFLDIFPHVIRSRLMVYDVQRRAALAAFHVELPKAQKYTFQRGAALSPDGSLLAVLSDGTVTLYHVG